MRTTITDPGAGAPVTTQAPDEGARVGTYVAGTDVTLGAQRYGRVVEIVPPLKYSGQYGNRYVIVDAQDRRHHVDGVRPVDPIAAAEDAATRAMQRPGAQPADAARDALRAARNVGAGQHLAAKLARAAYDAATDQAAGAGRIDDHGITADQATAR